MNLREELERFGSDGCTGFFDMWRNVNIFPCCFEHDMTWYLNPGDWLTWIHSNLTLGGCFVRIGVVELAWPAVILTSTIGAFLFAGGAKKKQRA